MLFLCLFLLLCSVYCTKDDYSAIAKHTKVIYRENVTVDSFVMPLSSKTKRSFHCLQNGWEVSGYFWFDCVLVSWLQDELNWSAFLQWFLLFSVFLLLCNLFLLPNVIFSVLSPFKLYPHQFSWPHRWRLSWSLYPGVS